MKTSSKPWKKYGRKGWTLEEKFAAVDRVKAGESATVVVRSIGASPSSISAWKKLKRKLCQGQTTISRQQKRVRFGKHRQMEDVLLMWFQQMCKENNDVSRLALQNKAREIYQKISASSTSGCDKQSFTASTGWLERFKKRHGIPLAPVRQTRVIVNEATIDHLKAEFSRLCGDYSPHQVYKIDEAGLFWKKMPTKTFLTQEETSAPGFKLTKERLSLLFCANAAGTDKLKPVVVGTEKWPQAFKNIKVAHLPVMWRYNSKAFIVQALFHNWFLHSFIPHVKRFLHSRNLSEKAVLVLNNVTAHSHNMAQYSSDFKVVFLPAKAMKLIQPGDQGVITNFKRLYTRNVFRHLAIFNIDHSWDEVSKYCLNSAWKKLWPSCCQLSDDYDVQQSPTEELVELANGLPGLVEEPLTAEEMEEHLENICKGLGTEELIGLAIQPDEVEDESTKPATTKMAHLRKILFELGQLEETVAEYYFSPKLRDATLNGLRFLSRKFCKLSKAHESVESTYHNWFVHVTYPTRPSSFAITFPHLLEISCYIYSFGPISQW
uniref:HTH CENPB-type domain-containing protein n=1 Tax=Eptatretus burgeri TaxID=7764 RepID=A0A8C4QEF8_EPTBU